MSSKEVQEGTPPVVAGAAATGGGAVDAEQGGEVVGVGRGAAAEPEIAPLLKTQPEPEPEPEIEAQVAVHQPPPAIGAEPLLPTHLDTMLPPWLSWLLSVVILSGIVVWLIKGNVAEGTLGQSCPVDSWLVPLGGGVLAYVAAYGFYSMPAKRVLVEVAPLLLIAGFAALFAWRGALLPYVIGCSSCSFMVILCVFNAGVALEGPGGEAVVPYGFSKYRGYVAFMLVLGNGVMNALGWICEHDWGWSPEVRWFLATFLLPAVMLIPALANIVHGQPNGQYNVPDSSTFIRLFISTRLGIYFCMYYFVHYHFEALITYEVYELLDVRLSDLCAASSLPCDSSGAAVIVDSGAAVIVDSVNASEEVQISDADINLWGSWEAPTAWGITAAWVLYNAFSKGLPSKIGAELCGCPYKQMLKYYFKDRAAPELQVVKKPDNREAGVLRWLYWSSGVIIGTLFMACSLPEVFFGWEDPLAGSGLPDLDGLVTHGFILWWKLILGFGMVAVHTGMMKDRTLTHNHWRQKGQIYSAIEIGGNADDTFQEAETGALFSGRGKPYSTDANWRANKAVCQIVQAIHLAVFIPYFLSHGAGDDRPFALVIMDGTAIGLLAVVNFSRAVCWMRGSNTLFWIVRAREYTKPGGYNSTMDVPGLWEPFVHLAAEPTRGIDPERLDMFLQARAQIYEDDPPGTIPWTFRSNGTQRTITELQEDAMAALQMPKTSILDNHTKLFIFLSKYTVKGGRARAELARDIKLPYPKTIINKWDREPQDKPLSDATKLAGGVEFHVSDELYAGKDEVQQKIYFGKAGQAALNLVGKLNIVDIPQWFDDEYEAIVQCESVMRAYMPPPTDPWKEMHSDVALSQLAFSGIAQLYIMHISGWSAERDAQDAASSVFPRGTLPLTCPKEKIPEGTEYILDLTCMNKYKVRDTFCRYGGAAFFNDRREVIAVYVCDMPKLNSKVRQEPSPPEGKLVQKHGDMDEWEFAKFSLRCSLVSLATLREHLCWCHWIISNRVSIASRERLNDAHPIRRVLALFTFRSAAINFMSAWTLMKEDMLLHRASAFEYNALKEAFADCLRGFKYETFPDMMKVKKMPADKAPLPIDKDGQLVWKNFMDFFTGYVEMYYPEGRKKVEDDQELQEYWSSLERATTEHDAEDGTHNGYGLPELSKKSLVEQLAHTAFWVTGMHEVSGSIVEMFESPRNSATKICQQGEDGYVKEDVNGNIEEIWVGEKRQTMADVQTFFQDMCVIASTGYRLPALMSDWKHLFLPDEHNKACKDLHDKLMDDLRNTGLAVWQANQERKKRGEMVFSKMDPAEFECSVNI